MERGGTAMKKYAWNCFFDFEKEEAWLNRMSSKGYAFTRVFLGLLYTFKKCPPGKYIYRMEMLKKHPTHKESKEYLAFMAEAGAEVVDTAVESWVYFRKEASMGPFEIFSDIASLLGHYRRVAGFWLALLLLQFIICINGLRSNVDFLLGRSGPVDVFDLTLGIAAAVLGAAMFAAWIPTAKQIRKLKREQMLHE